MTQEDRISALALRIAQEINDVRSEMVGSSVQHIKMTAAAYNALAVKDPSTVYYVTE